MSSTQGQDKLVIGFKNIAELFGGDITRHTLNQLRRAGWPIFRIGNGKLACWESAIEAKRRETGAYGPVRRTDDQLEARL